MENVTNVTMELIGQMMEVKTKYNILIEYLLNNARLNYNETGLKIEDVEDIVKALEPEKYNKRYNILITKDEMNK